MQALQQMRSNQSHAPLTSDGLVFTNPTRLSRIVGGTPYAQPYHRNATIALCDAPKKCDAPKESRECGDPSEDGAVAEASLGASDGIAGNHDEGVIVPKRDSEPSMSSVHVEPRCEPNVARDRPSVASVLLAISDRNRERVQESAAKKRANLKETQIETMVKMISESGREVADANPVATESPTKDVHKSNLWLCRPFVAAAGSNTCRSRL